MIRLAVSTSPSSANTTAVSVSSTFSRSLLARRLFMTTLRLSDRGDELDRTGDGSERAPPRAIRVSSRYSTNLHVTSESSNVKRNGASGRDGPTGEGPPGRSGGEKRARAPTGEASGLQDATAPQLGPWPSPPRSGSPGRTSRVRDPAADRRGVSPTWWLARKRPFDVSISRTLVRRGNRARVHIRSRPSGSPAPTQKETRPCDSW